MYSAQSACLLRRLFGANFSQITLNGHAASFHLPANKNLIVGCFYLPHSSFELLQRWADGRRWLTQTSRPLNLRINRSASCVNTSRSRWSAPPRLWVAFLGTGGAVCLRAGHAASQAWHRPSRNKLHRSDVFIPPLEMSWTVFQSPNKMLCLVTCQG